MTATSTNEQAFEALIEKALVGSTVEERGGFAAQAAEPAEQYVGPNQFYWGNPGDFNDKLAIDTVRLWSFLETTQGDKLAAWAGRGKLHDAVEKAIKARIDAAGTLELLRNGLEIDNLVGEKKLVLFYPKPSAADSQTAQDEYAKNQFSITRQVVTKTRGKAQIPDMTIFINGLPIFCIELKNPWTHQTARYNGIKQLKEDRDPREPLFAFGRCIAFFTFDKDETFFTTRLQGDKTFIMPFNKGLPDGKGAGNPVNPNGHKTSYLWDSIFSKDSIADIIGNFAHIDYGEAKKGGVVAHTMKNAKRLIFPRFHQYDAVSRIIADVQEKGVGHRYLIQHSAGSGKSNSITWLAFKLLKATPDSMNAKRAKALNEQLFQTVIIVTDRKILDKQLTLNLQAFDKRAKGSKIVQHADSSKELRTAIENGTRIILTTIQKFPFIVGDIGNMNDRNFAVIIDEAHSSQSGVAADKLNASLYRDPDCNGADTDDLIKKLIEERKMSENTSYFAFTATPTRYTLERFGEELPPDEEGKIKHVPFHLYSMKQAIEEGFIRDVLTNYTTYRSFYEAGKKVEENPEYNEERAQKLLKKMVEREPHTIAAKAEVMLDHFDTKVYRSHRLKGKAKAMVVTKDIECAIRYYLALKKLAQERNLPYKILVAFSGEKEVDHATYTEAELNGFPETKTAEIFDVDENKILVVANKYLTGFDQPKLCTMYIDKPLAGVLAVQTLSRLNRIAPEYGKRDEDITVLDFYNTIDDMKESFDPYFTTTTLSDKTDPNILHELRQTLMDFGVFYEDEINLFIDLYLNGADQSEFTPILDRAQHRFDVEIDWPELGKADFKMKCKQFVKVYSRLAALLPFNVPEWEKLYWFLKFLIPQLHVPTNGGDDMSDLLDNTNLSTYCLSRTAVNQKISLDDEETVIDPTAAAMAGASGDDDRTELDIILEHFRERHMDGWEATADEQKIKVINIAKNVSTSPEFIATVVGNPDTEAAAKMIKQLIEKEILRHRKIDNQLYRQYHTNPEFHDEFDTLVSAALDNLDQHANRRII